MGAWNFIRFQASVHRPEVMPHPVGRGGLSHGFIDQNAALEIKPLGCAIATIRRYMNRFITS
jgi:hypothetical protein